MIRINENYLKLQASYLFKDIGDRVAAFQKAHPDREIIKLGIGDVTRALPEACVKAFHSAVDEMADDSTFRGYGPDQGYPFLTEKIVEFDFKSRGADISSEEIFISDGAKCDTGNIQEIFAQDIKIAIPDPVYPAYLDTNVMAGRTGRFCNGRYESVHYLDGTRENGFVPGLPETPVDLIYLCFPNNPTGAVADRGVLEAWVSYARENRSLILYDAAYEAFIRDTHIPRSIYEIEGAREVAIEFRSFSKTAGFTGTRCAYTVVPKDCVGYDAGGGKHFLHTMWQRRISTKFNGVSYPVQKSAAAVFSAEGRSQVASLVDYYMKNAALIRKEMTDLGYECVGGTNSPYIWIDGKADSWDFFDMLLNTAGVVCTPGAGFGTCGKGFIRISAFNSHENVQEAMIRIKKALQK